MNRPQRRSGHRFDGNARDGERRYRVPARKTETITFKADESLLTALRTVENRSDFIRAAIMSALENSCPLCGGSGVLSPNQMRHWREFTDDHSLEECRDCSEVKLVCSHKPRS
jgi:hypothetical protein